ncbi:sporulation protein YqfD [Lederbergia sp. NSJ-179]|uniref:sporulation protein YqfD n=1 Tax=Lederbergia sp. NSJ-179 TaxID=2931402 RepID=UPI0028BF5080|nr:sporulation protein YqfD [Lederbergia sp. NSJ-179]
MAWLKNQWITFLTGRVLVKATGQGMERLLNRLARSGISIWNVKRDHQGTVFFYITWPDLQKLRHVARKADCSLYFIRGEGMPFLWKRTLKNSGFLIGILLFFALILFLSNITWGIQIKGADPETEHKIRKELTDLGIVTGSMHLFAEKPDIIQKKLTEKIDNITWVGVELKGTTYHFQVVQKTEPEGTEQASPRHLVANKKAVIARMFVEKGKALVKRDQFVEKGQILVSGEIGQEEKPLRVIAKGEVWGYTWYNTKVTFPLDTPLQVLNGKEMRKYSLKMGKLHLPIWGFSKIPFSKYETEVENRDLFFLGKKLPIQYSKKTIREKEEIQRNLNEKEALEAAKELARRDVKMKIPPDAQIDKEIILQDKVEHGKVTLSINFQVIENIAIEKPIIQGD